MFVMKVKSAYVSFRATSFARAIQFAGIFGLANLHIYPGTPPFFNNLRLEQFFAFDLARNLWEIKSN